LVFCSLNYRSKKNFVKDSKILIQKLNQIKPFDRVKEKVRFYYIFLSQEEQKAFLKNKEGFPPLKVRQDFLNDISAKLKEGYKMVIIDKEGSVSCAEVSSIGKMSLIILGRKMYKNETNFAKGFLHELGHSLGLRDECVSCSRLCPPGPPNCAVSKKKAQKWWGGLAREDKRVGYIFGCSGNKNYIRPTAASLMNNPAEADNFGPVNERYLKKALDKLKK
jgi:hypothetical protein